MKEVLCQAGLILSLVQEEDEEQEEEQQEGDDDLAEDVAVAV